jgi:DNA-binding NtrC family response regulator
MPRILTIEDDEDLKYLYEMMLTRQGYEVVGAKDITSAILWLTNDEFDLVILDMNMPDFPGTRLLEFVHDDPHLKHIPIVVISASDSWKEQVLAFGVRYFMTKPVTMQDLVATVHKVLED